MKFIANTIATCLLVLSAQFVFAADPLESKLSVYVVGNKDNKEVLSDSQKVEPGQVLEYQLAYTNNTDKPLKITAASGLIPENTAYVADSEKSSVKAGFEVSIDNGKQFEPEPVVRKRVVDGKTVEVTVPATEYTNVRWVKPEAIGAGKTQTYTYRVKVN